MIIKPVRVNNSLIKTNFKQKHHIRNNCFHLISKNLFKNLFSLISYYSSNILEPFQPVTENVGFFYADFYCIMAYVADSNDKSCKYRARFQGGGGGGKRMLLLFFKCILHLKKRAFKVV